MLWLTRILITLRHPLWSSDLWHEQYLSPQVLPSEKALQLLQGGKVGPGDFSAADSASRKLLQSLMEKRAEDKKATPSSSFYGRTHS